MTLLNLDALTVQRDGRAVVDAVSLTVTPGECIGLIGPNGAGKTTLMRAALGLLPHGGASSIAALPPAVRGKQVAWMPQAREIAWPVTVQTLVALGRIPHLPRGAKLAPEDQRAVDAALDRMGLDRFRDRIATRLSGGEQARALIARALAQDTPLLLADEPIAGLDPGHQIATMQVFADLARQGRSAMISLHDIGLAARHCTRLILMQSGRIVADGPPAQVLSADYIAQVFGVTAYYQTTPDGPVFQPLESL